MMSKYTNKIKSRLPEMEDFTRKYLKEILTIVAVLAAGFSSWKGFWMNGMGMSLMFSMAGLIIGIIFPTYISSLIHKFYDLTTRKGQFAEIMVECVKIAFAFIFGFVYFFGIGLLASTAYNYFSHNAGHNKQDRAA